VVVAVKLEALLPRVAAALVAVGIVLGTALDQRPVRPPTHRGEWRVLEVDLHAHTRFADGFLSPFDLVLQAERRGLDALAITDHNIVFPALVGRAFSRATGGPTILVGEEITTRRYHLHGIGLTERIDASAPLPVVLDAIHRQGAIAIAAHPVRRFWPSFDPLIDRIDGAEVLHPLAYGSAREGWKWHEMVEFYERSRASRGRFTAVGASDYHFGSPLGVCRTLVFARSDRAEDVLEALKAGRTVVRDLQGKMYGDPEMMALLEREPYTPRVQDYGYRGNGILDRVGRVLGLLGVLGIVLFGLRRSVSAGREVG
jgi:predicted metal-dependent phosphoesterase TrpH